MKRVLIPALVTTAIFASIPLVLALFVPPKKKQPPEAAQVETKAVEPPAAPKTRRIPPRVRFVQDGAVLPSAPEHTFADAERPEVSTPAMRKALVEGNT